MISKRERERNERTDALNKLECLLRRKSDQIERFGEGGLKGHLLKRYEMVHAFLLAQKKQPDGNRKEVALSVAYAFGRGEHTARWIIRWKRVWIGSSTIPAAESYGKNRQKQWALESLFCDERLQLAIREHISSAKDGKLF